MYPDEWGGPSHPTGMVIVPFYDKKCIVSFLTRKKKNLCVLKG